MLQKLSFTIITVGFCFVASRNKESTLPGLVNVAKDYPKNKNQLITIVSDRLKLPTVTRSFCIVRLRNLMSF